MFIPLVEAIPLLAKNDDSDQGILNQQEKAGMIRAYISQRQGNKKPAQAKPAPVMKHF